MTEAQGTTGNEATMDRKAMNKAYDIAMGYSVPLGLIERIADALAAQAAEHAAALKIAYGEGFSVALDRVRELEAAEKNWEASVSDLTRLSLEYVDEIAELKAQLKQCLGTFKEVATVVLEEEHKRAQLAERSEWADAEYNDIINVDNGTELRVVIDQSDKPDGKVHIHVRKRIDGEWAHVAITTLKPEWHIKRRKQSEDANG